jgi:hypothetical protein
LDPLNRHGPPGREIQAVNLTYILAAISRIVGSMLKSFRGLNPTSPLICIQGLPLEPLERFKNNRETLLKPIFRRFSMKSCKSGSERSVYIGAAEEPFDQYGRLLAYMVRLEGVGDSESHPTILPMCPVGNIE